METEVRDTIRENILNSDITETIALDEEIEKLELGIVNDELKLIEYKKEFDYKLLEETLKLEEIFKKTKKSELSTIQKRETEASKNSDLVSLSSLISNADTNIKREKIKLRSLERKFKIKLLFGDDI